MLGIKMYGEYKILGAEGQMAKDGQRFFGKVQLSDGEISQVMNCNDMVTVKQLADKVGKTIKLTFEYLEDRFGPKLNIVAIS